MLSVLITQSASFFKHYFMPSKLSNSLSGEYEFLFNTCIIQEDKFDEIDEIITRMLVNKASYDNVSAKLNIPWHFIAVIHCMEGSLSFKKHLHNGDPLSAPTVQVPKGRPVVGTAPFSWEESAADALTLEGFTTVTDWTIPGMLFLLERYNGMGYRKRGINSPYLWSYSNHYTSGKFTADGVFDPNAVSKQMGAAVILRRMSEKQVAIKGDADTISTIKNLGEKVVFDVVNVQENARQLQMLLNGVGLHLRIDGIAGQHTSDAYHVIAGKFLKGDDRQT